MVWAKNSKEQNRDCWRGMGRLVNQFNMFKICPNFLSFCRSKKVAPNLAKGVFRPMANEVAYTIPKRKSVKRGNGLRWQTVGAALAPTMRLTKSAAKYAGGSDCFREGCTIAQLRSKLRRKSLAKQNQQNISHVEPWQQKNMFLRPDLIQICLGEFLEHEARKGGVVCILSRKRTKSGHRANQQLPLFRGLRF